MVKIVTVTAALVAAVVVLLVATLPPSPETVAAAVDADLAGRTVRGAYHVHSRISDGAGDRHEIASAAARAGLRFVILTDHGDGTRRPEPAAFLDGVLLIDAVEISTTGGHYVALDLPMAPYPLGGDAAAVVEDVARLGGFGIAAHPDSARPALAWHDWSLPVAGLEWLNADSEWRDESSLRLARAVLHYAFRPAPAMASTLDRPVATLERWDRLAAGRPVVALAGHDAHGGIGVRAEDGQRAGVLGVPSYEASFQAFSTAVILDSPLQSDAASAARQVLDAIRAGRTFTAIDAVAFPAHLEFAATQADLDLPMGAAGRPGVPATFRARAALPSGGRLVLLSGADELASSTTGELRFDEEAPRGAYRVEAHAPSAPGSPPVPWLLGNPIYFHDPAPPALDPLPAPRDASVSAGEWRLETGGRSSGEVIEREEGARLLYTLGDPSAAHPFVALVVDIHEAGPFDGLSFEAVAERPMRVSVQLRFGEDERWGRSVYLDESARQVRLDVRGFVPAGETGPRMPAPHGARSLLFVVDLTNATPGDSGAFEIRELRFTRSDAALSLRARP